MNVKIALQRISRDALTPLAAFAIGGILTAP
jgi:hypothetical protein